MSESTWAALRRLLVEEYSALRRQLARQVDSEDLANDALQDTFLRLSRGGEIADTLESPRGYLYQVALNLARDRSRSERRRLSLIDVEAVLDAVDDQPGPAHVEEWKSDARLLERALAEMPRRRREIFVAAWIDGAAQRDIAARHGLSVRMVQIELKQAGDHVAQRFGKATVFDFAKPRRQPLSK
ncbi:MAG TPA: RNA polymerase sigma factor [Caulobacteraceae bacterium]|jgi:RNA polymerase sigma-70 factor (ECF subfamily)|nr:RNA polymerase sigma factor [Caulobacteraceae bacterium]